MSVRIESPKSDLIFPRIRSPSCSPGPRYEFTEERFALSYEALKTNGTPASSAILATRSAINRACASLSITHGPAIKNSGLSPGYGGRPCSRLGRLDIFSNEDSTAGSCSRARTSTVQKSGLALAPQFSRKAPPSALFFDFLAALLRAERLGMAHLPIRACVGVLDLRAWTRKSLKCNSYRKGQGDGKHGERTVATLAPRELPVRLASAESRPPGRARRRLRRPGLRQPQPASTVPSCAREQPR